MMMTIRSHDQFNTTIYGLDDRYRGIRSERRVVLMNAEDLPERGLRPEQLVDLTSHFQGETRVARRFLVVEYPIPRRCCATYFPEANVLVPLGAVAQKSNTPASKSVVVTVAPSEGSVPVHPDLHGEAPARPLTGAPGHTVGLRATVRGTVLAPSPRAPVRGAPEDATWLWT